VGVNDKPEQRLVRRRSGTAPFYSPLRYPGGKRKIANFIALLIRRNGLLDGDYAEVYAGGAAVALSLLYGEYVRRIHINDLDRGVHAFWMSALTATERLCARIRTVPLTIQEWDIQRAVYEEVDPDPLDLAVATFYLNRTNRSGIITGGVIGGRDQTGRWKLDARFDREKLVKRILRVGRNRSRINLHRLDGADFLVDVVSQLPQRSLTYLDPPYFVKGQQQLYANYYRPADHAEIARQVQSLSTPWMVSYDDVADIRSLYFGVASRSYSISYSANARYRGREIAFFSKTLVVPEWSNPARLSLADLDRESKVARALQRPSAFATRRASSFA
jgi:DNA adenine methylase